ncbi:MAG: hypothetical protein ACO38I_11065, partial [Ilumatobacteraceae bacterium]
MFVVLIGATGLAVGPSGPVEAYGVAPWANTPGPGGGTVYYYNADGFSCGVTLADTCHYLEFTDGSGGTGWNSTTRYWSSPKLSRVADTSTDIGTGAKNTSLIAAVNSAAGLAATDPGAFVSASGHEDWYLPSRDELTAMRFHGTGALFWDVVGSSSQHGVDSWWAYKNRSGSNEFIGLSKLSVAKIYVTRAFSKSDATLAAMSVSGETLSPSFDPAV